MGEGNKKISTDDGHIRVWRLTLNQVILISIVVIVVTPIAIVTMVMYQNTDISNLYTPVCKMHKKLQKLQSENIDLRVKAATLEAKLEQKSKIEPNSRHAYDCKPSKKGEVWTHAIQSLTQGKIWTFYCMSHSGHTNPERRVPEGKRLKLTCQDERGTKYPLW